MRPDIENDTHSPWYEAFAQQVYPPVIKIVKVAGDSSVHESVARCEVGESDGPVDALFDCYNG